MMETAAYLRPKSVAEAISSAMEMQNDFRFIAGGTDVLVNKFQGNEQSECLIDLSAIDELKNVLAETQYDKVRF